MNKFIEQFRLLSPAEMSEVVEVLAPLIVSKSIGLPKVFNPGGKNKIIFKGGVMLYGMPALIFLLVM